jgi:hypothetical protein
MKISHLSCPCLVHPLHYRHSYHLKEYRWSTCLLSLPTSWFPSLFPLGLFVGVAFSFVVPRCQACLVLLTRSVVMRFPFLVYMSLPPLDLLPVLLPPRLLTVMMKFSFRVSHIVVLWFYVVVMLWFLPCPSLSHIYSSTSPPLVRPLNLPCSLAALADALSGMVNADLLLLFHMLPHVHPRTPRHSIAQDNMYQCFDHGGPLACRLCKPFCRQWYLPMLQFWPCFAVDTSLTLP